MKRILLFILTIAIIAPAFAQKLDRSKRPQPGPAPEITLGKTEQFTLPNGLRVFVVENHKLPLVSYNIQLDIHPVLENNMAGYTQFLSELLTAGTKNRTKDELNKEIDFIGARLSAYSTGMYGQSLKKHQEKLLDLMSDIAMNADFQKDELEKIRTRMISGLKASENEPDDMLNNVSAVMNYTTLHPYGEVVTEETVNNVTLERCNEYYNTYYRPNVAYMAIVGDITAAEVKPLITKYFGNWQRKDVPVTKYINPKAPVKTNVAFVPRDAAVQSVINVTYPIDLEPGHPDVIKAKVANAILGGGSTGRLFLNLREEHAWTYGSYSSISQDDLKGKFTAYAKCRNEVTDSSVAEIIREMNRMRNEKVTKEDLARQIAYMSGSFAIGLEDPKTVAQYAINTQRYNMPKDYYQNYLKNLSAVTVADVQNISKKYIDPNNAHIVVVGSKDEVADKLKRFDSDGKIDYYDNYGNKIVPAVAQAAPSDINAAVVMTNYINAIGGEKAIRNIKDMKVVAAGNIDAGGQEMEINVVTMKKAPSNYKMAIVLPAMGMTVQKQVFNGTDGYMEAQGQKIPMGDDDKKGMVEQADLYADLTPEKYGVEKTLTGVENLNGEEVYVLNVVNAAGTKSKEYYSKESGLLVKQVSTNETPQGAQTTIVEFADYQKADGTDYMYPHTMIMTAGGQTIPTKVTTIEINKGIEDSEFE